MDSIPDNMQLNWIDPLPEEDTCALAANVRGVGVKPEWMKAGSGLTTQSTQYLAECDFIVRGKIGYTQPRRMAAVQQSEWPRTELARSWAGSRLYDLFRGLHQP